MLSNNRLYKSIFLLLLITLISGCTKRTTYAWQPNSTTKTYTSTSTSTQKSEDRSNIKVGSQEIKNSAAMHRATMRPYTIAGKMYYPTVAKVGDTKTGIASWYGPNFHAKQTSNGEIYNMYANTAAHKTLPMNTMVKVNNLENGKTVIVRINDRGPFVTGRIIDLSNKAAHAIDMVKKGTAKVKIEIIGFNAKVATTSTQMNETATVGEYYVQVGAFQRSEGANEVQRKFKLILDSRYDVIIKKMILNNQPIHRVWISGFRSENEAIDFKEKNNLTQAMIIAN